MYICKTITKKQKEERQQHINFIRGTKIIIKNDILQWVFLSTLSILKYSGLVSVRLMTDISSVIKFCVENTENLEPARN